MTLFQLAPEVSSLIGDALLDRLQTPIWVFDIEQERIRYANAAALTFWEADTPQSLYARDFSATMSEAARQRLADYLPRLASGEIIDEHWNLYPGERAVSLHCRFSRLVMSDGRDGMLVEGIDRATPLEDSSSLRDLEAAQRVSRRQLEVVIEGLDMGLLLEDEHRRVIVANQAFCDLFGFDASPERLADMDCREAACAIKGQFTEPDAFVARIEELIDARRKQTRDLLAMTNGRFLERSYTPLFVAEEYHGHLWVYRDVTRQQRQQDYWAHQASTDPLTGLANRRSFDDAASEVAQSVERGEIEAALLMIDIDRFKAINDSLGHAEGDKGLQLLANTLRDNLRQSDLPCRTGGEEFMVIMPDMAAEEAQVVAWRLLRRIAEASVEAEQLAFHFTVSIGVTRFRPADTNIQAVTQRADAAMYQAKHMGRNCVAVRW